MNIVLNVDPDLWLHSIGLQWCLWALILSPLSKTYGSSSQSFLPACCKWVTGVPGDTIRSKSPGLLGWDWRQESEPDSSHDKQPPRLAPVSPTITSIISAQNNYNHCYLAKNEEGWEALLHAKRALILLHLYPKTSPIVVKMLSSTKNCEWGSISYICRNDVSSFLHM